MTDTVTATIERVDTFSPGRVWLIHYRQGNVCGVVSTHSDTLAEQARRLVGKRVSFSSRGKGAAKHLAAIIVSDRFGRRLRLRMRPRVA